MLVWINGPFGGGKTQTAYAWQRRRPGSVVCDPELVGFGLQRMAPRGVVGDFQDLRAWRSGVVEVLDRTLRQVEGDVVAPMTLVEPDYFEEIVGGLRARGHTVHHVALLAERETVRRRLRERVVGRALNRLLHHGWDPGTETFALRHLDRCLDRLRDPMFAVQIDTDRLDIPAVAEAVAAVAGVELLPDRDGPLRRRARELAVGVRHLRLG